MQVRNALCNSLLIDPADMGVEDVLALHGAAHLPRGSAAALDHHARKLIADHSLEVRPPQQLVGVFSWRQQQPQSLASGWKAAAGSIRLQQQQHV